VLVLVADDDATCRLVVQHVVERLGHRCIPADDGEQAWRVLQDRVVDVLVTDWMMPGLDGPELCRRVRSSEGRRYTYIILATGLSDRDDMVAGMEAGADDYLTKPIDPFDVQTRLIAAARVTGLHHQLDEFRTELERLNDRLAIQARTDPLTELGNRLRLHEDLSAVHTRAAASGESYALAMCDLDWFKGYNDTNGHLQGDEALRQVAAALARGCRVTDRAYRYGGEEFVIVFNDETIAGATTAAERLRRSVELLGLHRGPEPGAGVMTISVGVAGWDVESGLESSAVLEQADAALYEAKEEGRNRVVTYGRSAAASAPPEGSMAGAPARER
jgi:two-component system, cell cycle response regulator